MQCKSCTFDCLPYEVCILTVNKDWDFMQMNKHLKNHSFGRTIIVYLLKASLSKPQWYSLISVSINMKQTFMVVRFFSMMQQPLVGQVILIIEASRSHSDTPHSADVLWTCDEPDAETATYTIHTHTLTRDRYSCPRQDSDPQSQ
jgi:hypothetical protein